MLRHLIRILWNRRRTNGLVLAEAFIAFLVLFSLTAALVHAGRTYLSPIGFEYDDKWAIRMDAGAHWTEQETETVRRLLRAAEQLDRVEHAFVLNMPPFHNAHWRTGTEIDGRQITLDVNQTTDDFAEIVGLDITRGRWFGPQDDGLAWEPVVINRQLAELAFPGEDATGRTLIEADEDGDPEWRVVGVVSAFRQTGEMYPSLPYAFTRFPPTGGEEEVYAIHVEVTEGTTAAFEEPLGDTLRAVAPGWSFSIKPWTTARQEQFQQVLTPLVIASVVVASFLLMVALGLLGVLWQTVSQRTSEFGIRRAIGASGRAVRRQVTLELSLLVGLGSLLGTLFAIQAPWLGINEILTWSTTLSSLAITVVAMGLLSWLCAGYPSWLATRIDPADALHYE